MKRIVFVCTVLGLAGCAATEPDGIIEPSFDSKSDFYADIAAGERIDFGEEVGGEFDRDFQFFSFVFRAAEGAEINAEVTRRGTSSGLDTTLFLYRLRDFGTPTRITMDDDDGWGGLSKLSAFELYTEGEYALIVGTKHSDGRGAFNLALGCDNGACVAEEPPAPACPEITKNDVVACLDEATSDWGFEAELTEVLAESCGGEEGIRVRDGVEDDATAEACIAWSERAYPPTAGRTADLLQLESEPAVDDVVARVSANDELCGSGDDYGCEFQFRAYTYDTDYSISAEELLAHARLAMTPGPGVFVAQKTGSEARDDFQSFLARFGITEDVLGIADTLGGSFDYAHYGAMNDDDFQWNYGDCSGESVVVDFFEEGLALELSVLYCSG